MSGRTGAIGLLIASFGGPEGPDEVMPFLRRVTAGRGVPDERLAVVAKQYDAVGGVSPLNQLTRELATAVDAQLRAQDIDVPVGIGYRNAEPSFEVGLRRLKEAGCSRVVAIVTSAYSSHSGCGQYRDELEAAARVVGVEVHKVEPFHAEAGFRDPITDAVREAAKRLGPESVLVATAHSIPLAMAQECAYVTQLHDVLDEVATQAGLLPGQYELAYQSRSGAPGTPWLEPDVNEVLARLAAEGHGDVVLAPIGFVNDHMEVVHDLDVMAIPAARALGLTVERVATPGSDPRFVTLLTRLYVETSSRWEDDGRAPIEEVRSVCGQGCCASR